MKKFIIILLMALVYADNSFASENTTQVLQLHEAKPGEAGGAIQKIKEWYMSPDKTIYKIASVDLNSDGTKEVIVHMSDPRCQRKHNEICNIFIMKLKGDSNKHWDSISHSIKAKSVKLLNTATKGWRDLLFDDKLLFRKLFGV
ncbi:MAG: hypothetical protein DSY82_05285 [Flavobacteriia bacterium]|nr:MAG: hypothetical protein DSY82_05285 [Flavobacteriia bacterium]